MLKRRNLWMLPAAIGASLTLMVAGAVLANGFPKVFSDETASATPSVGFASTVIARGTFAQNYTFGTPKAVTITRKVRVKTKSGFVTKTIKIKVDSAPESHHVRPDEPLRHGVSAGNGSAGRVIWLAYASRRDLRRRGPGGGHDLSRHRLRLSSDEDRCGDGLCSDADRASHGPERGDRAVRRVHALRPPARNAEHGNQNRPAPAGGLPLDSLDGS